MRIRVYYEDTDVAGVVYHANYLKFIERARSEMLFSQGVSPIQDNCHFMIASISADFVASARFGEELDVKTEVLSIKAVSLTLRQHIYRGEQLIFRADVKLAYLNQSKPAKIPENLKKLFANGE